MGQQPTSRWWMITKRSALNFRFIFLISIAAVWRRTSASILDNGVIGDPKVDCMEDRVRLTFRTERPFNGRIFVKGMIEAEKCVSSYASNSKQLVDFQLINGQCNMRRSRKLGPDQRGVEQSITVIISFHNIFITKVDRAYRCTCFYMEADKVVTNRFDVSMLPTTDLIDTARMPLCTYTVRRGSVNGPVVTYATVGEPVFHVWSCDSDMFAMLVHNCFVDDGAGKDRKPLIDEHGCTIDPVIVADLTYNNQANLAYSEVNVFKFADKITTYFQCAVSTCMVSEGMCKGKTPPRCGVNSRRRRTITVHNASEESLANANRTIDNILSRNDYVMDLAAEKIVVLDLEDSTGTEHIGQVHVAPAVSKSADLRKSEFLSEVRRDDVGTDNRIYRDNHRYMDINPSAAIVESARTVCLSYHVVTLLTGAVSFSVIVALAMLAVFVWRQRSSLSIKIGGTQF